MKTDVMKQKSNTIRCPICGTESEFKVDSTKDYWFDNDTGLLLKINCKNCRNYPVEAIQNASGNMKISESVKQLFDSLNEDERAFISQMTQRAMDYDGWWLHWSQKMLQNILNDRRYAYEAAARWGLRDVQIEHHGIGCDLANMLFFVIAGEQRFTIRIYRPSVRKTKSSVSCEERSKQNRLTEIRSLLFWLKALREEAGLPVLEPVPTPEGSFIQQISIEGLPPRYCVMYHWIEGKLKDSATPRMYENYGMHIARMHRHSETFAPPGWFGGYRCGREAMHRFLMKIREWRGSDSHPDVEAIYKVLELMEQLGEGPEVFGLVHEDASVLFEGDEVVGAFDFDSCNWMYYLDNIAQALRPFWWNDALLKLPECQAFLAGYERVRPLPERFEDHFDLFIEVRKVGWCGGREAEWFQVGQQG